MKNLEKNCSPLRYGDAEFFPQGAVPNLNLSVSAPQRLNLALTEAK